MLQFVVPQFIDVEDKILGPITVRQFIMVLIWGVMSFLMLKIFGFATFLFLFLVWSAFVFLLAFVKINGRPFHYFILSLLQSFRLPKLRVWHKQEEEFEYRFGEAAPAKAPTPIATKQALTASRLTALSLVVDTGGAYDESGDVVAPSKPH